MKRILRFIICFILSFVLLWLSGYGNLMNDISESLAVTSFIGGSVVLSLVFFLGIEMYLHFKTRITELTKKVEDLESKLK